MGRYKGAHRSFPSGNNRPLIQLCLCYWTFPSLYSIPLGRAESRLTKERAELTCTDISTRQLKQVQGVQHAKDQPSKSQISRDNNRMGLSISNTFRFKSPAKSIDSIGYILNFPTHTTHRLTVFFLFLSSFPPNNSYKRISFISRCGCVHGPLTYWSESDPSTDALPTNKKKGHLKRRWFNKRLCGRNPITTALLIFSLSARGAKGFSL